jgi:hypothetical protein
MPHSFKVRLKVLMNGQRPYSFAKKIGLEKGLFQYYWQKGGLPTCENLLKIQRGTGCSLDWLLTGHAPTIDDTLTCIRLAPCGRTTADRNKKFVKTVRKLKKIYSGSNLENLRIIEGVIDSFSD